jgi:hypothetical protein
VKYPYQHLVNFLLIFKIYFNLLIFSVSHSSSNVGHVSCAHPKWSITDDDQGNGRTGSYAHMEGTTKTVIPSTWVYKPHCTEPGLSWIITTGNGPCPMKEKQSNCFTVPSSPNKNVYKEKGKIQQTSKR